MPNVTSLNATGRSNDPSPGPYVPPGGHAVTLTASATLGDTYHRRTILLSAAAGLTVTLPASSGSGIIFEIFVLTTVTSNDYIIQVANSTDILAGVLHLTTDIAGTSMPTSTTSDTITMNGSTTGGLRGSWVKVKDVSSGFWSLEGGLICTGAEATPFSAAV